MLGLPESLLGRGSDKELECGAFSDDAGLSVERMESKSNKVQLPKGAEGLKFGVWTP